jgi:glyoxylase-like metal-dependent hydrolase (beta-lactamase superfamily II)
VRCESLARDLLLRDRPKPGVAYRRPLWLIGLVTAWASLLPHWAAAQSGSSYRDGLLQTVRSLARAIPGDLPTSIGYLSVQDDSSLESDAVDGAPRVKIYQVTPVFQIRFHAGWIMVDAAYDRQAAGTDGIFFQDRYDQILAALRGADLIVVTHEHGDHVGTLLLPAVARDVAFKTMLTRQQEQTLIDHPRGAARLDAADARRYLVVDYQRVLPIAPGVVLIRAPGHTPGSQMVYVRLASGHEVILAGDVVWHSAGIETEHQKPDSTSRQLGEDRAAIGQEIAWLKSDVAPAGIAIAVSHDGTELRDLVRQGVLIEGLQTR